MGLHHVKADKYRVLFVSALIVEMATITSTIMLPTYVGSRMDLDQKDPKAYHEFMDRVRTSFFWFAVTSIPRIILSVFLTFVLVPKGTFKHNIWKWNEFFLAAFATAVAHTFYEYYTLNPSDSPYEMSKIWQAIEMSSYYFLMIGQTAQITAMVHYYPWTKYTLGIYKGVRIYCLVTTVIFESVNEGAGLPSTMLYITAILHYLYMAFAFVDKRWKEISHHGKVKPHISRADHTHDNEHEHEHEHGESDEESGHEHSHHERGVLLHAEVHGGEEETDKLIN